MMRPDPAQFERLQRENRELREELAEYRRWEAEREAAADPVALDERRIVLWRDAFRRVDGNAANHARLSARLLVLMVDGAGRDWSKLDIDDVLCREGDGGERRLAPVAVCALRGYLRALSLGDPVETIWGHGYRLPIEQARRMLAFERGLVEAAAARVVEVADSELAELRNMGRRHG